MRFNNNQMTIPANIPGAPVNVPGSVVVSNQTITITGHVYNFANPPTYQNGTEQQCNAWIASHHLRQLITYQPASCCFWAFQWYETAIFLTLVLAGLCYWRIRRHLT